MSVCAVMSREARVALALVIVWVVAFGAFLVTPSSYGVRFAPLIIDIVVFYALILLPAYVVALRRGAHRPWLAFVPFVGFPIVLLRSVGQSAWWTVLILIPYLGIVVLDLALAFLIPKRHGRSGWWTPAFIFLPFVSFYAYAFTLPRQLTRGENTQVAGEAASVV